MSKKSWLVARVVLILTVRFAVAPVSKPALSAILSPFELSALVARPVPPYVG